MSGEIANSLKLATIAVKPQVVFYSTIERGKLNYGPLLSQISFTKPDIVILAGEYNDAGNLVKDFPKYGLATARFIGGDGVYHHEFIEIGGKITEGAVVVSAPPIVDKDFILRYKNHFNHEPTGYSANTYDATNILIEAIRKVKVNDSEKVASVIAGTMNFKGVTGTISFDEKGDLTSRGFVLNKVVGGRFKVIDNGKG